MAQGTQVGLDCQVQGTLAVLCPAAYLPLSLLTL